MSTTVKQATNKATYSFEKDLAATEAALKRHIRREKHEDKEDDDEDERILADCTPGSPFMDPETFDGYAWDIKHNKLPADERKLVLHQLVSDMILRAHYNGGEKGVEHMLMIYPWLKQTVPNWRDAVPDPEWSTPVIAPEPLLWSFAQPSDLVPPDQPIQAPVTHFLVASASAMTVA